MEKQQNSWVQFAAILIWPIVVLIALLTLHRPITNVLMASASRIASGTSSLIPPPEAVRALKGADFEFIRFVIENDLSESKTLSVKPETKKTSSVNRRLSETNLCSTMDAAELKNETSLAREQEAQAADYVWGISCGESYGIVRAFLFAASMDGIQRIIPLASGANEP